MATFAFWKEYLRIYGKPRAIYPDKFSTYKMTQQLAQNNHDTKTQFQRANDQVGIEPIFANSPQAKGRVERLFGTLQDRLIKEMRLRNISTIPEANAFLRDIFIPEFNERFGVLPASEVDLHRPLRREERILLDSIFSRQTERVIQNDFTVSFTFIDTKHRGNQVER